MEQELCGKLNCRKDDAVAGAQVSHNRSENASMKTDLEQHRDWSQGRVSPRYDGEQRIGVQADVCNDSEFAQQSILQGQDLMQERSAQHVRMQNTYLFPQQGVHDREQLETIDELELLPERRRSGFGLMAQISIPMYAGSEQDGCGILNRFESALAGRHDDQTFLHTLSPRKMENGGSLKTQTNAHCECAKYQPMVQSSGRPQGADYYDETEDSSYRADTHASANPEHDHGYHLENVQKDSSVEFDNRLVVNRPSSHSIFLGEYSSCSSWGKHHQVACLPLRCNSDEETRVPEDTLG